MDDPAMTRPDLEKVFDYYGLRIIGGDRGGWRKATCPLPTHEDNNPSASVNTDEGKWFCHACGPDGHGDAYDIVKARENVTAGWSELQRRTHEIAGGDSAQVPPERDRSSLLSGRPRSRPSGSKFVPAWRRL